MERRVTILTADDHPIFRKGLNTVISGAENMEIIGEAGDGKLAVQKIADLQPDVVLLDVNMPVLDGIETAKIILRDFPLVKIIFLTLEKDRNLLSAINDLGISGYLLKDDAVLEVIDCIKRVAAGGNFVSSGILNTKEDVRSPVKTTDTFELLNRLTPTESKILLLICEGTSNKKIADSLSMSVRTAEHHHAICAVNWNFPATTLY